MNFGKYSIGIGDRYEKEAAPQPNAVMAAMAPGVSITHIWNLSNREHFNVHSTPGKAYKTNFYLTLNLRMNNADPTVVKFCIK